MTKKMGFWLWLVLLPIRLVLWILGVGKEATKGRIVDRAGVACMSYMIISFPILLIYDYLTNLSLTNYSIFLIMTIVGIPGFIIMLSGMLYQMYLEEQNE